MRRSRLLRLHTGVTQRRTHPHLIAHPNRLVTRPQQQQTRRKAPAQKPSSVHERHYHSQRPAASRRPGTPLGPVPLPRSPPRPPPPVVCPPGGGRRRPVASSAVLRLVRPPATVGSNVDVLPGCRGMRAGMPVAGRQLAYVGIRAGCEPASSTVSGGTGVRSSALHTRAGRAGVRARASCSSAMISARQSEVDSEGGAGGRARRAAGCAGGMYGLLVRGKKGL